MSLKNEHASRGVSIIIPALNGADNLDLLLSSFFEVNTHSSFELIIIEQGSIEGISKIVAKYSTSGFLRLIRCEESKTFGYFCRHGASKARYPFLAFINPWSTTINRDMLPDTLEKIEALQKQDSSEANTGIYVQQSNISPMGLQTLLTHLFTGNKSNWEMILCQKEDFDRSAQSLLQHNNDRNSIPKQSIAKGVATASPDIETKDGILYIIHNGGGGMVHNSFDLARDMSAYIPTFVLKTGQKAWQVDKIEHEDASCISKYSFSKNWKNIHDIDDERKYALEDIYKRLPLGLVHIRVLLGNGPSVIDYFKKKGLPVIFSFHDFSAVCPNIHLVSNGTFCHGNCNLYENSDDCHYPKNWFGNNRLLRPDLRKEWSGKVGQSLTSCDSFIVTSDITKDILLNNYPDLQKEKFYTIEHGRNFKKRYSFFKEYKEGEKCDIFFYGALNAIKGCSLVHEIIKINDKNNGPFRFHIIGNIFNQKHVEKFESCDSAVLYGKYNRDELESYFEKIRPTLTIIPSNWHETFSHTLTESWAYGVPVLGTSLGAVGERIRKHEGGWILSPENPQTWYDTMLKVVKDKKEYRKVVHTIQSIHIKSCLQMTKDYMEIYNSCLRDQLNTYPTKNKQKKSRNKPAPPDTEPLKQQRKDERFARILKQRLWNLGFLNRAYSDLNKLVHDQSKPYLRRLAAWELALWHADQYHPRDAEVCLHFLEIASTNENQPQKLQRIAVLQAESYDILGVSQKSKNIVQKALSSFEDPNLYLASANTETTVSERMAWINKAFRFYGLPELSVHNKAQTCFDGLHCKTKTEGLSGSLDQNPKVTVIIPAYNSQETLPTAIEAILAQSWKNLEIFIVDDCSSDNTLSVARIFEEKDNRVQVLQTGSNQGPYAARNTALQAATGDVVTCNDADDWSHPLKIEMQLRHLFSNPGIVANISKWSRVTNDLNFYRRGNPGYYIQPNVSSLMFYLKHIKKFLGFWDSVRFDADTEFIKRIKAVFGNDSIAEVPSGFLSLARCSKESLTENKVSGYPGFAMGARKEYRESYLYAHRNNSNLKYEFPQSARPFPTPLLMQPRNRTDPQQSSFDLLIVSDFRQKENRSLNINEIQKFLEKGLRIGLVQMAQYEQHLPMEIHPEIRGIINKSHLQMLVYGDKVSTEILLITSPVILQEKQKFIPEIYPKNVGVVIDQKPGKQSFSDLSVCEKNIQHYFKISPKYFPFNSDSRKKIETLYHRPNKKNMDLSGKNFVNLKKDKKPEVIFKTLQKEFLKKPNVNLNEKKNGEEPKNHQLIENIEHIKLSDIDTFSYKDTEGIAIIIPCTDTDKALNTSRTLYARAGIDCRILLIEDNLHQGFIQTINQAASRVDVKYLVYLTPEAFPGVAWLKTAWEILEETGKGLLAFNCGRWHGRIAAFGMVRPQLIKKLYDEGIFCSKYESQTAGALELTAIARAMNTFAYNPDCTLVDLKTKQSAKDTATDWNLFHSRFSSSFDGIVQWKKLKPFKEEYPEKQNLAPELEPPRTPEDEAIQLIDVRNIDRLKLNEPHGIAVIMPCIDTVKGMDTARLLHCRAGIDATIIIVEDTLRQGFIKTLNDTASRLEVKYLVYLAEDAFPGINWLKIAHEKLEKTGKGLLAFNCGKWKGRIAAFGMVRKEWVKALYGDSVLYQGYKAHKADNELTAIARVTGEFVYAPDCLLVEYDAKKVFKENVPEDKTLFHDRFRTGFNGIVLFDRLAPLAKEYFVPLDTHKEPGKQTTSSSKNTGLTHEDSNSQRDIHASFFKKPLSTNEIKDLKKEYVNKGLDKEPDTFVLYRIIGNDLYPRHKKGQSRENLRFLLENEPEFENCEKRFIVNRIIDPNEEKEIVKLLDSFGAKYSTIPFKSDEYKKIGFDLDALNYPKLREPAIENFMDAKRQRLQLSIYRLKNNYVMNNNGARNFALREGRLLAKWVLPFDGNIFITPTAWQQLQADILEKPYLKYFVVPMTRVTSNEDLIKNGVNPEPTEEPQLAFRRDAREEFDEALCYGRRPKVEMFWRLKIAGRWDKYENDPWDLKWPAPSPEARQFGAAGWVARLFSGMAKLETQDKQGADKRFIARSDAILNTLRALDAALADASAERPTSIRAEVLEKECCQTSSPHLKDVLDTLKTKADEALARGPYSVVDKTTLPPSGDKQDYWHPAPYWWPDPEKPDGLPYIRKDGQRMPGTRMYEPESEKYDRTRLQRVFDDSFILALAWKLTGDNRYAEHGAAILERFFVNPDTQMNPHLKYGQVRMGHNDNLGYSFGLIEMKDMYFYLDAVRLFKEAGSISGRVMEKFCNWLESYLDWLLTSPQGKKERGAKNNHGTCYDMQVAAIASFLDKQDVVYDALIRALSRISQQFAPDGSQPDELKRKTTAHYCCFNFQSWINLAELASHWGVYLWDYEASSGAGLKTGARWLLSHVGKKWPYEQIDEFDYERFHPIWFAAREHIDDLPKSSTVPKSSYLAKPIFFPHDGIRPFWNLGSSKQQQEERHNNRSFASTLTDKKNASSSAIHGESSTHENLNIRASTNKNSGEQQANHKADPDIFLSYSLQNATPLIVFGRQRAGTRFVTHLLNHFDAVTIQGELPSPVMTSMHQLILDVESYYSKIALTDRSRGKKEYKNWLKKKETLLFALWSGLNQGSALKPGSNCRYFGYKRPKHEFYFDFYENSFTTRKPFYIYCVRNFKDNYLSIVARWPERKIVNIAEDYLASLRHYKTIKDKEPQRILLFNLDDYIRLGFEYIEHKILRPLDLNIEDKQRTQLKELGPVNTAEQNTKKARRQELTEDEQNFIDSHPEIDNEFNELCEIGGESGMKFTYPEYRCRCKNSLFEKSLRQ